MSMDEGHIGWCCCWAVYQSIIPSIGGTMWHEELPHNGCFQHHSLRWAHAPAIHPQHSLAEREWLKVWLPSLQTVMVKYGAETEMMYLLYICVWHKGSMNMGLWHQLLRSNYIPLFQGHTNQFVIQWQTSCCPDHWLLKRIWGPDDCQRSPAAWIFMSSWQWWVSTFWCLCPMQLHVLLTGVSFSKV